MNPYDGPLTLDQKFYLLKHRMKIDQRLSNKHQQEKFLVLEERIRIMVSQEVTRMAAKRELVKRNEAILDQQVDARLAARAEKGRTEKPKTIRWTPEVVRAAVSLFGYRSRNEFQKNMRGGYSAARRLGLLQELFPIYRRFPLVMPDPKQRMRWTEQAVRKLAGDYDRRGEFNAAHGGAYRAAKRLGLLDELFPLQPARKKSSQDATK